jgi:hypothetical protein
MKRLIIVIFVEQLLYIKVYHNLPTAHRILRELYSKNKKIFKKYLLCHTDKIYKVIGNNYYNKFKIDFSKSIMTLPVVHVSLKFE